MGLWPTPNPGSFEVRDAVVQPRLSVCVATLAEETSSPMHLHEIHDQLVYIADGLATLRLEHGRRVLLEAGSTLIIPAGRAHGFSTGRSHAHIMTVFMGDSAEHPGKTMLPERVRRLMRQPHATFLFAARHEPAVLASMVGCSKDEAETFAWAMDHVDDHPEPLPWMPTWRRENRRQAIKGWIYRDTFYLSSMAINTSLAIRNLPVDQYAQEDEQVVVEDMEWINHRPEMIPIPVI